MESHTVLVHDINLHQLDASDLVFLFGRVVDILSIDINGSFAFVTVPNQEQAIRAIHELFGRYIPGPNGELAPLRVSLTEYHSMGKMLPAARVRRDLATPMWQFRVKYLHERTDFDVILDLFRPFGTVCWSGRDASGTVGYVIVRTAQHWASVLQKLHGTVVAGQRLSFAICMSEARSLRASAEESNGSFFVVSNIGRDTDFRSVLKLFAPFGTVCWSYRHVYGTYGAVIVKTSAHWNQVLDALRGTTLAGHRLRIAICKNDVRSRELPESVGLMPRGTPWDSRVNI
ncbi:hypothetical protein pipiens_006639 [Culex pipiens pipiens]|uniref:RRM domain-containing protein n=1 Tax=Culex pipiens pipiens TaxID=38569 RepID=A0ABD1DR44_CULPP